MATTKKLSENTLLLREARKIVSALGKMFAPSCEVVLHDLTKPQNAIIAIENPLSGRKVNQATTEMGLARVKNPHFPDIVQNYTNTLPDGRSVKSTSIGIKNSKGKYIAAICLNLDVSLFSSVAKVLEQLVSSEESVAPVRETLLSRSTDDIRKAIENFSARHQLQPRALNTHLRNELILQLHDSGLLQLRGAATIIAEALGISRGSVYNALKVTTK